MQALASHTIRAKQAHVQGSSQPGAGAQIPVIKFVIQGFPHTREQVHSWVASGYSIDRALVQRSAAGGGEQPSILFELSTCRSLVGKSQLPEESYLLSCSKLRPRSS